MMRSSDGAATATEGNMKAPREHPTGRARGSSWSRSSRTDPDDDVVDVTSFSALGVAEIKKPQNV